jgi:TRAP-type uncharacterized transport system fused permease subunit
VGFSPRFAGAVEASASCGGQVTPPIMGAAAFIMAETLGIPYNQLILIAVVPAALHYPAILVHGPPRGAPAAAWRAWTRQGHPVGVWPVLLSSWHLFIPLAVMVTLLLMQYTPFLAAFWGIIADGRLLLDPPWHRSCSRRTAGGMAGVAVGPRGLCRQGFEMGAKSALGIGAACACVGFVLGITTLTGMGFKFSAFVLDPVRVVIAQSLVDALDAFGWFAPEAG